MKSTGQTTTANITSKTLTATLVQIMCCHRIFLITVTKNDWKVSRLLVAMQERHIQLTFHRI